jgi:hypothetical protein
MDWNMPAKRAFLCFNLMNYIWPEKRSFRIKTQSKSRIVLTHRCTVYSILHYLILSDNSNFLTCLNLISTNYFKHMILEILQCKTNKVKQIYYNNELIDTISLFTNCLSSNLYTFKANICFALCNPYTSINSISIKEKIKKRQLYDYIFFYKMIELFLLISFKWICRSTYTFRRYTDKKMILPQNWKSFLLLTLFYLIIF